MFASQTLKLTAPEPLPLTPSIRVACEDAPHCQADELDSGKKATMKRRMQRLQRLDMQ